MFDHYQDHCLVPIYTRPQSMRWFDPRWPYISDGTKPSLVPISIQFHDAIFINGRYKQIAWSNQSINTWRHGTVFTLVHTRIISCLCPANEKRCCIVTSSLIGWVHTQNDPLGSGNCKPLPEFWGDVSLTIHELSKIVSWNLYITKIVLLIRISSWNFARVPKAMLWARTKFQLEILSWHCIFSRNYFGEL